MEKTKLDAKDWKILKELDSNCRQSDAQIGKKVGMSQQVVTYRIGRLVKSGVIRQFTTVVDITKLGYSIYKIYFKLQKITKEKEERMIQFLVKSKNVVWVCSFDGTWDLHAIFLAKTVRELDSLLNDFSGRFGVNILYKTVLLLVDSLHFIRDSKGGMRILNFSGNEKNIGLDDSDRKILSVLATNARLPFVEISKKTGLGLDAVRYRIKKLVESGAIIGFRVWVDQNLVGNNYFKILICLQNTSPEKEKLLFDFCKRNPNMFYIVKAIGVWDLEFEVLVKDNKELREIILELRNNFQDIIRSYEPLQIFEEYKVNYCPFL